jgi:Sulfotransferase family
MAANAKMSPVEVRPTPDSARTAVRPDAERLKVLYITSMVRSGSTVLGNVLGAFEGFFSGGEIKSVWHLPEALGDRPQVDGSWLCGCGVLAKDCPVWKPAFEIAFGGFGRLDLEDLQRMRRGIDRIRYAPLLALPVWRRLMRRKLTKYAELTARLYRAISQVTGCRVIVDGSKEPLFPLTLNHASGLEVYVVHLVRDPRGCAFSLKKKNARPDTLSAEEMLKLGTLQSSIWWSANNIVSEAISGAFKGRYMRFRYEDFVAHPQTSLTAILDMLGENAVVSPFLNEYELEMPVNHTLWGNPNRMRSGRITLRPDAEWLGKLGRRDRILTEIVTWPLLRRYGYSR